MLSKFFITATVIIIAFLIVRQRHLSPKTIKAKPLALSSKRKESPKSELAADLRTGAYIFLFLMVGLGAALYYFDWVDDHIILTINLHRDNLSEPVSYEVYKYQLEDRSFITTDGRTVTVAGSERMEILGLND